MAHGLQVTDGGDFWKGVPLVPPRAAVIATRDAVGRVFYVMPPAPGGERPYCFMAIYDPIRHPETWAERKPGAIQGGGRDTAAIARRNAQENEELGLDHDWAELWGREEGKVCLMVCGGPTLTESLPEIAKYAEDRERFFTMGHNRSFRAMDLDYFVSMDRVGQDDWIPRDPGDTVLVAATTSNPHVAKRFKHRYWGDNFLYGVDCGFAPLRTGLAITLPECMFMAYKLGAREIWLYGADFALTGAHVEHPKGDHYVLGKYYFDSAWASRATEVHTNFQPEQIPVRGIHGKLCFTNYELWSYAAYTTAMCMMLQGADVKVRNKSKSGILFWGTDEPEAERHPVRELLHAELPACG